MTSSTSKATSYSLGPLLKSVSRGNKGALGELYRLTSPKLFSLLVRMLKREDLAEEVLQDGFLSIWRHAKDYDSRKGAPFTWMASIIRHRAIDQLRRSRHEIISDSDSTPEPKASNSDPWEGLVQFRDAEGLRKCLEELGDDPRRAIVSAYYEGLTHEDLALRMNKPLGTVKTWIRRGLMSLKDCLER